MAGYTRQSLAQILNGEIVSAPPLNAEFNQILAAFNNSTGHKHDGTAAEGPPIDRIADSDQNNLIFVDTSANQINFYVESSAASVGQISIQDGAIVPFTDNDIDLGSSSFEFKDLYIDGTANIDSLVADTADINAGTIDNTVIGATTPAAATFTNLTVSTGSTINFSGATVSNGGTFTTVTISGGTITGITDLAIADGGTGASTASVARTNLGVAIGTNVQAYDAGLQSISGLTTTADQMIYTTSSDTYATTSLTSAGRALLDDASASAQRTTLGLGTLATQDANSVAITGGTISGISNISDPGTSLPYTFSTTTTDSDPGSGIVRLNNATQNAATEIYIDDEDNDGTNVSGVIALLAGGNNPSSVLGYVTIRKEFAPENFITMKITTLTSASGYTKLVGTVEASSGATPFSDTDNLYFSIDVSGDKGDPGDLSGPGSSTDNAVVRWDGTSGATTQNSSVTIDDSGNVTTAGRIHSTTTGFRFPDNTDQTTAGVIGPASSTDNALVRFDGAGGSTAQNSGWILSDANALTAGGDLDMSGYDLTVDFSTVSAAGEHAEENNANATGTVTIQATDPTVLRRTLTGDVTLLVAGAPTPGKGWSTELRTTQDGTGGRDLTILPANLLTYTEQFDNAAWTKTNVTPTANSVTAPHGITTADTLTDTSSGSESTVQQSVTSVAGSTKTASVFLKESTALETTLGLNFSGGSQTITRVTLTWATHTAAVEFGTPDDYGVEVLADGWYRLWITDTDTGSNTSSLMQIFPSGAASNTPTTAVYAWGAQINDGSLVGYAAVGATRAASVVWRGGTAAEIDYAAQAAAAESRIIIGVGSDGEILIDDVSVET
jgi:hypothetical protein